MSNVALFNSLEELESNIEEINRLNLAINLSDFKNQDELFNFIQKNFCGETCFIALPDVSRLTYLPIYYPDCGPIIEISASNVVPINSFGDIKGSTREFKLLHVDLSKFQFERTEELFINIVQDYQTSVKEYANRSNISLEMNNLETLSIECPLGIWISL